MTISFFVFAARRPCGAMQQTLAGTGYRAM